MLKLLRPYEYTLFPYTTLFRSNPGEHVLFQPGCAFGQQQHVLDRRHDHPEDRPCERDQRCPPPGNDHTNQVSGDNEELDRKSTRLNSSHVAISYAVFCLKKKKN